jgi:hypothetical protein
MYIRKRSASISCEVKKNGKRFYKGGFKSQKAAKEWGNSKEGKK